jgi:hypothetical protein
MSEYPQYQIITAAEATALWRLEDSTLRRAIMEKRLLAQKSGKVHLVDTADVKRVYGEPKPATEPDIQNTFGETFFVKNDSVPLRDCGRVPGAEGRHVLTTPSGETIIIGGYWLRREGETWDDFLVDSDN